MMFLQKSVEMHCVAKMESNVLLAGLKLADRQFEAKPAGIVPNLHNAMVIMILANHIRKLR
jgi:hypothetical protein